MRTMETVIKQETELDTTDVPAPCESVNFARNVVPLIKIKNEPCDDVEEANVIVLPPFHCKLCNKTFAVSVDFDVHLQIHQQTYNKEKLVDTTDTIVKQEPELDITDVLPSCKIVTLAGSDVPPIKMPIESGIEILSIPCKICHRFFLTWKDLEVHSLLHQLTFKKSQPRKETTVETNVKDVSPFQVKKCKTDKTYVRPAKKAKVDVHKAEPSPFLCKICSITFDSAIDFDVHTQKHHQTLQETTVKQEPELDIIDELAPCKSEKLDAWEVTIKQKQEKCINPKTIEIHSTDAQPAKGVDEVVVIKAPPCHRCHKPLNSSTDVDLHSRAHEVTLKTFKELRKTEDVVLCEGCYTIQKFTSYHIHLYDCRRIYQHHKDVLPRTKCYICSEPFWGKILLTRHLNDKSCSKDSYRKRGKVMEKPNVDIKELVNKLLEPHRKKKGDS